MYGGVTSSVRSARMKRIAIRLAGGRITTASALLFFEFSYKEFQQIDYRFALNPRIPLART